MMKTFVLYVGMLLLIFIFDSESMQAQSGDQILDGIGETDLISRYIFNGNTKDWTRNNLHASIVGSGVEFVYDAEFGRVINFPKESKSYISLPADWMSEIESMSITGWIYLNSDNHGQVIFDFGKSIQDHFFATPTGMGNEEAFQNLLITRDSEVVLNAKKIAKESWHHFAIVMDLPATKLRIYLDGEARGEATIGNAITGQPFAGNPELKNEAYLGKSLASNSGYLDAKLHDFRIYNIPLSKEQVNRIRKHSFSQSNSSNEGRRPRGSGLEEFPDSTPQLYNAYLTSVPDIQVETQVNYLPRLPRYIKGVYSQNISGPMVRVLWPAPDDNSQVLTQGSYMVTGDVPGTDLHPKAFVTVVAEKKHATPDRRLEAFSLDQVSLNNDIDGKTTKFVENRNKFINGLLSTNPDDFLYMFRNAFGQKQPVNAKALKVWDSQETKLRGHATGHYLSALAQAYGSTFYDDSLRAILAQKMDYMVNELYELSQMSGRPQKNGDVFVADPTAVPPGAGKNFYDSDLSVDGIRSDYWNWGEGFISAYPPDQFIMLENGASYGGGKSQVWAPYYTLHKILAGLMDVYEISGNEKALAIVRGMSDWVYARLSRLPDETLVKMWNSYIAGEYGGMNDAMARLYRLTMEPHYLELAQVFDNIRVFFGDTAHQHGMAKNVDMIRGLHANQHIPQIMGALETYRASKAPEYYHIAENFWNIATKDYMYSIGGVAGASIPANAECFTAEPASLYHNGFSAGGQNETCATYNMLKLSRNLFLFKQQAEFMDYYERGLYNHILASVAHESPANTYHVPLRPASIKHFSNGHMDGFTCCNGTALESSTKLQNSIYFKSLDNKELYVNLFVPSTLNWTDKKVTLVQETAFPFADFTRLRIEGNGKFNMLIRVPQWATNGFFVKINGKKKDVKAIPGSYLSVSRKWKDGDVIELHMPFEFRLEPVMDQQNIASLFYGPVLLAAQEKEPRNEWRTLTLNAADPGQSISGDEAKLEFMIDGILFKPFFETYERHSVYLNVTLK